MLRALGPDDLPPERAYAVPWLVVRSGGANVRVVNLSYDTLTCVRVTLLATGELLTDRAHLVHPLGAIEFTFPQDAALPSAVALVAWTHDALEYLYRVTP